MHEVALSQQLAGIVTRACRGRHVTAVQLRVGHLRQVVPDAMQHAWQFTVRGTELADAVLEIEQVPVELSCRDCSAHTHPEELTRTCAACGSRMTDVTRGEEFLVVSIDVDDHPSPTEEKN